MRSFTINGRKYNSKEADFNMICEFELMGVQLSNISKVPTTALRAYFAFCSGLDETSAGIEMAQHMIDGGDFTEISEAFRDSIEESGFFRALNKNQEEEVTEVEEQAKAKRK